MYLSFLEHALSTDGVDAEWQRRLDSRCSLKVEGGGIAQQEKNHGSTNPASAGDA
jgi:hypothetical protein